jgi:hypothetical protein
MDDHYIALYKISFFVSGEIQNGSIIKLIQDFCGNALKVLFLKTMNNHRSSYEPHVEITMSIYLKEQILKIL